MTASPVASVVLRHSLSLSSVSAPILAFAALSPTPQFVPLVLLLTLWRLNTHIIIPRKQFAYGALQAVLVALAIGVAHGGASLGALSTPSISVIVMGCFSLITTFIAQSTMAVSYYATRALPSPWAQVTFFPALWATVWGAIAHISPVGRLVTWSPVLGLGPYSWIRPVFGQWGLDWVVGAWAMVLADVAGNLLVGQSSDSDSKEPIPSLRGNLVSIDDDDDNANGNGDSEEGPRSDGIISQHSSSSSSWPVVWFTVLLAVLAAPSFLGPTLPLPLVRPDITPLNVACALPDTSRSGHYGGPATLTDYIEQSKKLQSTAAAEIILWPEGAVRFDTAGQRDEAFKRILEVIAGKRYWGISFEEHVQTDSPDGMWKAGMRRNGLVVLTQQGPVFEYYKRKLVPIAESFTLNPSSTPPGIYDIPVPQPKNWNKSDWSSLPGFTRPVPFTASICLDFASPSSFAELESRPALILAPARTWHVDVGYAMWEQAKARAEELGSVVLWCDGGAGGVSGVAGQGMHEVQQVGQGSWVRRIGVQWPFDRRRTPFAAGGEFVPLVTAWGLVGLGWAVEVACRQLRDGEARDRVFSDLWRRVQDVGTTIREWRRSRQTRDEERPLLE